MRSDNMKFFAILILAAVVFAGPLPQTQHGVTPLPSSGHATYGQGADQQPETYSHQGSLGDTGYVHDTTGDFGPYYYWK